MDDFSSLTAGDCGDDVSLLSLSGSSSPFVALNTGSDDPLADSSAIRYTAAGSLPAASGLLSRFGSAFTAAKTSVQSNVAKAAKSAGATDATASAVGTWLPLVVVVALVVVVVLAARKGAGKGHVSLK